MTSRSLRILEMARNIVRKKTCEILPEETKENVDFNNESVNKEKSSGGIFIEKTCEILPEETKENVDFNNESVNKEKSSGGIQEKNNKSVSENFYNFHEDPTLADFDSDDTIKDPNFILASPGTSFSSSPVNSLELSEMGEQLEENLLNELPVESLAGSPAPKRSKLQSFNKRKIIKEKRNTGKTYETKSGKKIQERKCVQLNNNCRKQCKNKIPFLLQKRLFKNYWDLGSYNQRILYIGGLIEVCSKKQVTVQKHNLNPRNRNHHLKYFIPTESVNINVCQRCFKQCFNETNNPYCFMWHEALAKRGGNEIASCLLKHLKALDLINDVKTVILYSDNCPGQNKNSYLSTMFMTFLENSKNIECIHHKFLVPGHSHMECDVDHALIERKKKNTSVRIHHPYDWYNFVRTVGVKNKFYVIEMQSNDFMNFSTYLKEKFLWRNRNENSIKFIWKNVKWLKYSKNNFGKILYKNSLNLEETFQILNIRKRGVTSVKLDEVPKLPEMVPISIAKKKDIQGMFDLIYPCFHNFYNDLITENLLDIHPELTDMQEEEII